jgi:uncharacterized protein YcnI
MKKTLAASAAIAFLVLPASAVAHISIHPDTIPANANANVWIRVPGEQVGAHVTKVDVEVPPGLTSVEYANVPGWSIKVVMKHLSTPIKTEEGPVSEEVQQLVWTWAGPAGQVNNGQFIAFPITFVPPVSYKDKAMLFPTVQDYSNGAVVHWISTELDAEHPAPRVNITAEGGAIEEIAGKEAGPLPGQSAGGQAVATSAPSSSNGTATAALIVGIAALIVGIAALVRTRTARSA